MHQQIKKSLFVPYKITGAKRSFFIYQRPDQSDWLIPTGTCETKEKQKFCAWRELTEELGQNHFRNFFSLNLNQSFATNFNKYIEEAYAFELGGGITPNEEIMRYKFVSATKANQLLKFSFHKESIIKTDRILEDKIYPKIFVLIGPGGSGKDTLQKLLIKNSAQVKPIKTIMTRPATRPEDKTTRIHFDIKEFEKLKKRGEFIETNKMAGNYYASSYSEVIQIIGEGNSGIINLDINGARKFKQLFSNTITIFIYASIPEIRDRLRKRNTDSEEWIEERVKIAEKELAQSHFCDYVINNRDGRIDESFNELDQIIKRNI